MRALAGAPADLARAALAAGCDLVLHCTGRIEDTAALLAGCPALTEAAAERLAVARAAVAAATARRPAPDPAALRARRDAWLSGAVLAAGGAATAAHADPTA
jgi:beta-N-acetylhexosaminidase